MIEQLPFNLTPDPKFLFENFVVGSSNREAYSAVKAFPNWPAPVLIIHGPIGCGKTHLGQAWLSAFDKVVFVDDASKQDEYALFSVINQALNGDNDGVLLADEHPTRDWGVKLADLNSRLNYIPKFSMIEPDDEILESIIRKLFEDKGRAIKADSVAYILTHYDRSIAAISNLILELNHAASVEKKDITRNFIAGFLKRAGAQ